MHDPRHVKFISSDIGSDVERVTMSTKITLFCQLSQLVRQTVREWCWGGRQADCRTETYVPGILYIAVLQVPVTGRDSRPIHNIKPLSQRVTIRYGSQATQTLRVNTLATNLSPYLLSEGPVELCIMYWPSQQR